jgi:uncharacterized membrane protein YfcA
MLDALPLEAVTMMGSTVLGGVMKMWGQASADKAEQFKMMMQRNEQIEQGVQNAREMQNPNAAWVRRFIVVTAMLGGLAIVFAAPLLGHSTFVPVEVTSGFKFLFLDFTNTITEYKEMYGFVTPDWIPFTVSNVVGFYFGSAAMQRK